MASPVVIEKGHDYLQRFATCEGTILCREIRGDARLPTRCIGVVQEAAVLYAKASATEGAMPLAGERRAAYSRLCAHWGQRQFHCAHAVLRQLDPVIPVSPELLDSTSAFVGGTACSGGTCSALTAGVMALGLRFGDIERSRWRVLRMVATMAVGGHAFADKLNAFNRIMNLGHRLATWFETEFGSTQCRTLTGCNFASVADVNGFIEGDGVARCEALATRVAERVRAVMDEAHAAPPHAESSRVPVTRA